MLVAVPQNNLNVKGFHGSGTLLDNFFSNLVSLQITILKQDAICLDCSTCCKTAIAIRNTVLTRSWCKSLREQNVMQQAPSSFWCCFVGVVSEVQRFVTRVVAEGVGNTKMNLFTLFVVIRGDSNGGNINVLTQQRTPSSRLKPLCSHPPKHGGFGSLFKKCQEKRTRPSASSGIASDD